jgi:hypothetical protein
LSCGNSSVTRMGSGARMANREVYDYKRKGTELNPNPVPVNPSLGSPRK